ncbi:MAG TPA: septal ring lytic transglycosylase RlpA family protein [Gaiellaceae bacterium]|nr:septal ring lytic transglycosylase RlpA family protein [Gaiellaceae bacterium]
MTLAPAQRLALLAGTALLAAALALAARSGRGHPSALPEPVGSYTALAGSSGVAAYGKRTACGLVLGPRTEGVAHPVLPCGVRLYLTYQGRKVLTQVIDRGPLVPGRQFELTDALARRLGLTGVQRIAWSYATR